MRLRSQGGVALPGIRHTWPGRPFQPSRKAVTPVRRLLRLLLPNRGHSNSRHRDSGRPNGGSHPNQGQFRRGRFNGGPHIPRPRTPGNAGSHYQSAAYSPLSPGQVRDRQFPYARRGLDPYEVHRFLHRVANELAAARTELAWTRDENARIKRALSEWQSHFTLRVRG
jgi:DivIVA domain-containing protein